MSKAPLLSEVRLRYQGPGHLRFQLPAVLCTEPLAQYLEQGLQPLEGVRRVQVWRNQGKLSIFYLDTLCDRHQIVRKLAQLLDLLLEHGLLTAEGGLPPPGLGRRIRDRVRRWASLDGFKSRFQDWQNQTRTAKALLNAQWRMNPALRLLGDNPEKALVGFINDSVTFYLIKVHWDLILGKWLKSPLKHRYEWLTVFYFVYLLVRSRK
ncbi:MAG: hypothetical protein H7842_11860 [Gammaproteobacteria bacterium SHHR-1]|jgi:hypothetical protein|uniref:hypothetical protein n=1 Tax=Magnetovirga frankeli TaxID=947516 RepID=UPI0012933BFF|nr:hypothetical protein D5125_10990 [gamma proteobacterium SS-5]